MFLVVFVVSSRREANIRGGGKTVHVVFIYLSRSLLQKERDGVWQ
jgi:hypothetical protein